MEDKNQTLILIAAALLIVFGISLFSLLDTSGFVPIEAVYKTEIVYEQVSNNSATAPQTEQNTVNVININYATQEELMLLDGIGEKKAKAIIDYRNARGYFSNVYELTQVDGINKKLVDKNINRITV